MAVDVGMGVSVGAGTVAVLVGAKARSAVAAAGIATIVACTAACTVASMFGAVPGVAGGSAALTAAWTAAAMSGVGSGVGVSPPQAAISPRPRTIAPSRTKILIISPLSPHDGRSSGAYSLAARLYHGPRSLTDIHRAATDSRRDAQIDAKWAWK